MNYQEFLTDITTQLSDRIEAGSSVQIQTITKNNGTHYDGIVITRPGVNISPTIYLMPYYHRYLDGVSMEDIYADILTTYQRHFPRSNFDTTCFTDYAKAGRQIVMRLVNYEKNRELLSRIPHFRYLDFAIIFYCQLPADAGNHANILIYHQHLEFWNIDSNELYRIARINTPLLLPHHMESMQSVLKLLPLEDFEELHTFDEDEPHMYVLSNHYHLHGASVILYDGLLQQIAERLEKDFIVLPSSIHEVLVIPADHMEDAAPYLTMVKEVNETQLADDEILSDHVYYFSRESQLLTMYG